MNRNVCRRLAVFWCHLGYALLIALSTQQFSIAAQETQSELIIEVTTGVDKKTRIGVVPFAWLGQGVLVEDVARIVEADLYRSGLFEPLERGNMLSRPADVDGVVYREWRALDVDYVILGRLLPKGLGYRFEMSLVDALTASPLIEKFEGDGANLRDIGHLVSDKVYEKLTGIPGAFSTQILYVTVDRTRERTWYRLRRADADGHRVVTLFESDQPILSPAWSPDGRKVAYVSYHDGRRPTVVMQDIASGRQTTIASFKGINGAPAWSPDGRYMAVALSKDGNPEIYLVEMATGVLRRITNHYAIDTEPRWMPDGQRLIFTSDRPGNPQIYEYHLREKALRRLTFNGSYNARGAVSADGRYLAMVHRNTGEFHIAVQDLWRDAFRVLTQTPLDESPSIAPNGSMVIYATQEKGLGVLSAVSLDGRVKVRLPAKYGEVREPAWSPFLKR
jgi:TolB protein